MRQEYVAAIFLFGLLGCIFHAHAQDIIFPGQTERPSRFPLTPGKGQPTNKPNGGVTQEQYNKCVDKCRITSEYNPVCGSDDVTYQNPGAFNCAVDCGNSIQNLGLGQCSTMTTSPVTSSTTDRNDQNDQNNGTSQEQYNTCVDNCRFTAEYNPQCGSDGVTYQNPGALGCALTCGNPIQNLGRAPCDQYSSTTPVPN